MLNFTPEDLLLFQAGELDELTSSAITEELKINWSLREKYNVLQGAVSRINSMKLQSPRRQTIQNIMCYAMHRPITV